MSAVPYSSVPVWISNKIGGHLAAVGLANELMAGAAEIESNARTRRFVLTHEQAQRLVAVLKQAGGVVDVDMRRALQNLAARTAAGLKDAEVRQRLQAARLPVETARGNHWIRFMGTARHIEAAGFSLLEGQAWPVRGKWWQGSSRIKHCGGVETRVEVGHEPWPELYDIQLYDEARQLLDAAPGQPRSTVVALGGNVYSLTQWRADRHVGYVLARGA